jgi:hypothetical protein
MSCKNASVKLLNLKLLNDTIIYIYEKLLTLLYNYNNKYYIKLFSFYKQNIQLNKK